MNSLLIGIIGVFLVLVGVNGNAGKLADAAKEDIPQFIPWAFALGVILVMSENEYTEKFAKPFLILLVLNFFLSNWPTIESQSRTLFQMATTPEVEK